MLRRIFFLILGFLAFFLLSMAASTHNLGDGPDTLITVLQICIGLCVLWEVWECVSHLSRFLHPEAYKS